MTIFDYTVLTIVGISVLLSLMRGFVREMLSLLSWVAAILVAKFYTLPLAPMLPAAIPGQPLRMLAAFLILFLGTFLVGSLISVALSEVAKSIGLGWVDRWLGVFFGLLRGVMIAAILVLLGGLTSLPHDARWRNAMFSSPLEAMVSAALPWLPQGVSRYVKYD